MNMKPSMNRVGAFILMRPLHRVAIQPNTWMPVGIATAMLAAEIRLISSTPRPAVNMWWAHRPKLKMPTPTSATTITRRPTRRFWAMVGIMVEIMPAAGRKMM